MAPTDKTCTLCGESKPLDAFHNKKGGYLGRRSRCRLCHGAVVRAKYESKPEVKAHRSEMAKTRYRAKRDMIRAQVAAYNRRNKDKNAARVAAYNAAKNQRSPSWLTPEHEQEIARAYTHARDCAIVTGEPYEVDHIVPLRGTTVSGLHVPWNLQVLPADVNRGKAASFKETNDVLST